ncbi:MAG: hypothetical protein FDZ75_09365 [Actinobacteria bacterium]|nr:MAG: hypothetical protein FDZ75_09365 [Actinomycetota bacterium]
MREKLMSIGDDSWIEDADGNKAFKVNGKALRIRETFVLEDSSGNEVASIQEKKLSIRDKMEIERGGHTVATIHKAMIAPLRERYKIDLDVGGEWEAQGNIVDHEYKIHDGRADIAEVSKKWFRVRDTYGVEIEPDQDDALVLAVTVAIDAMRD